MTKKQTAVITMLTITVFILALLVSGRFWFRLDLTKNRAYTISEVSRNLFAEIPDPVSITYYLSDKLKAIDPAPGEVEDILREYAAYSRGKITFSVRDPVRAGLSMFVEELGLLPRQTQEIERDQASFVTVYSGIVIEYLDRIEVIPWIFSTGTLEYDLTSRIRSMITNTERVIGILMGDSFRGWGEDFGYLAMTFAEAGYRVQLIYPGEEIPDNLPALFVLGGTGEFGYYELYRIDRYIQLGGKVLFAAKGMFVDTIYGSIEASHYENPVLLDMIASYGVIVRPEFALDRNNMVLQYQTMSHGGGIQYRSARYPLWIGVPGEYGNTEHPVSAGFSGLDLFWSSPLELYPPDSVEAAVLFTSSPEAWSMKEFLYTSPEIPYLLEVEAPETTGTKILGASLTGVFPSFFRDAPKPVRGNMDHRQDDPWSFDSLFEEFLHADYQSEGIFYNDEESSDLPDMPRQASPSRIIVIGDVDFATDIMGTTQAAHNLDFLLRAADWLVNDDDIIGIRNRQPQAGRFDKITDTVKRASAMRVSRILNVVIVPLFVIAAGIVLSYRRKKREELP